MRVEAVTEHDFQCRCRKWAGKPDAEVLQALGADESKLDLAPTTPVQRAAIDKYKLQRRKQRRHWQVPEDFPNRSGAYTISLKPRPPPCGGCLLTWESRCSGRW